MKKILSTTLSVILALAFVFVPAQRAAFANCVVKIGANFRF